MSGLFKKSLSAALTLCLSLIVYVSCGFHDINKETASVTFRFDRSMLDASAVNARTADGERVSSEDFYLRLTDGLFADVVLEGTYNIKKTVFIQIDSKEENGKVVYEPVDITFEGIPVGAKIRAVLNFYAGLGLEGEDGNLYYYPPENPEYEYMGKSNYITVKNGINLLEVNIEDAQIKIYVNFDSAVSNNSASSDTGKGTDTDPFKKIQSAIDYVKNSTDTEKEYVIELRGYDEDAHFEVDSDNIINVESVGNKKISLIGEDYNSSTAITGTSYSTFILKSYYTTFKFKNIKIENTYTRTDVSFSLGSILYVQSGDVILSDDCIFEGTETEGEVQTAYNGGAVYIDQSASVKMESNSKITNCGAFYDGGGAVFVNNGSFIMEDSASIEGCYIAGGGGRGGAVYVNTYGTFELRDSATIKACTAAYGGGVYAQGKFIMSGGSISECTASTNGGAVYVYTTNYSVDYSSAEKDVIFEMSGGHIYGNSADSAGSGVYVNCTWNYDNDSSHSYYYEPWIALSGDALIDSDNDVYLSAYNYQGYTHTQILLKGDLKNNPAAFITLGPSLDRSSVFSEENGNVYSILADENGGELIKANRSKLPVNPFTFTGETEETQLYIAEDGYLADASSYLLTVDYPVQIGDIVLSDGNRVRMADADNLSYTHKNSIAGMIFYAGNETDILGSGNLMVAMNATDYTEWYIYGSDLDSNSDGKVKMDLMEFGDSFHDENGNFSFWSYIDSFDDTISEAGLSYTYKTQYLVDHESIISNILSDTTNYRSSYKALSAALIYGENFEDTNYSIDTANITNNWYVPTLGEMIVLFNNLDAFFETYQKLGGIYIKGTSFWTATTTDQTYNFGNNPSYQLYVSGYDKPSVGVNQADNAVNNRVLPIHVYTN